MILWNNIKSFFVVCLILYLINGCNLHQVVVGNYVNSKNSNIVLIVNDDNTYNKIFNKSGGADTCSGEWQFWKDKIMFTDWCMNDSSIKGKAVGIEFHFSRNRIWYYEMENEDYIKKY